MKNFCRFFLMILAFIDLNSSAQVFIMNEDFTDADSITPPMGWSNLVVSGNALYDKWNFETMPEFFEFPISDKAAIFQAEVLSNDALAEIISLETPILDCSISPNILLFFDHEIIDPGMSATCVIEFFDGFTWQDAVTYTTSTDGVQSEVINLSSLIGGITNAKLRFTWSGNGQGIWIVDNIKVFSPLSLDMNLAALDSPQRPFQAGNNVPVSITLQNQGLQNISNASIQWTVDGVSQSTYNWSGNLAIGQEVENVQIGTFAFNDGDVRNLKIWINGINGQMDLNHQNDTISRKISAGLCGTYTIGGSNPHFENFTEAVEALEIGGITCPVFFNVRDGVYNEQILINSIAGTASNKRVTFRSQNMDTSLVALNYQEPNLSDFTLNISGAQFISFEDLSILRTNGTENIILQGGASHLRFERCNTGKIAALDDANNVDIVIKETNLNGNPIEIKQPAESVHGLIQIEDCFVGNIYVNNSGPVILLNNRYVQDTGIYVGNHKIEGSNSVIVQGNRCKHIELLHSDTLNIADNFFYANDFGAYVENVSEMLFVNNRIKTGWFCEERGLRLMSVRNSLVKDNVISMVSDCNGWGGTQVHIGIHIGSTNSRNLTIRDNTIERSSNYSVNSDDWFWGLLADGGGDSIYIKSNSFNGRDINGSKFGKGMFLLGTYPQLEADSNSIQKFQNIGIEIQSPLSSSWKFKANQINFVKEYGISLAGENVLLLNNRIWDIKAGTACKILGSNNLIANNYLNALGPGVAKGLSIEPNANANKLLYNSVYITGTNLFTALPIDLIGGSNNIIKNNSLYNEKNGRALSISTEFMQGNNVMDYNNLYTKGVVFALHDGENIEDFDAYKLLTGYDQQSISANPFYIGINNLAPNNVEMNESAQPQVEVTKDIMGANRGLLPDIGAKQFVPCTNDAGVSDIIDLAGAVSVGSYNVQVQLQNHGQSNLTNAVINWSVNDQAMTPFNWNGSLGMSQTINVSIGSYVFQSASQYDIKVWTNTPNGLNDCNHYNDTSSVFVATPLCGTYTLGGINPDFDDFNDAIEALNNSLITCPVIFDVRSGFYNEQATMYDVQGSSQVNTITFRGQQADSSLAQWKYVALNSENDFTLTLFGSKHIYFQDLTIARSNGLKSILINGDCSDLHFDHCLLGNILSPNTEYQRSNIEFNYNAMGNIYMYNVDTLTMRHNMGVEAISNSLRIALNFENSSVLNFENNKLGMNYFVEDSLIVFYGNDIRNVDEYDGKGISLSNCVDVLLDSNLVFMNNGCNVRAIHVDQTRNVVVKDNVIYSRSGGCWNTPTGASMGVWCTGSTSSNIEIRNNLIGRPSDWPGATDNYGVLVDNAGDSIYIKDNFILGYSAHIPGYGLVVNGSGLHIEIDSNHVENVMKGGIMVNAPVGNFWKVRENVLDSIRDHGILITGNGVLINANKITNVNGGNGITIDGDSCLVQNNSIHTSGLGVANGIVVKGGSSQSKVLFNSVNVTSRDLVNASALKIDASVPVQIKNNIFSNQGGGFALSISVPLDGIELNANNYYSSKQRVAYYLSEEYSDIVPFSAATGWEILGKEFNPFYQSDTVLYANHGLLNNVGLANTGVVKDIVNSTRGALPDLGVKEFSLCSRDAGVEEFLSLSNPLPVATQSIQVRLRNHGTGSISSTTIHWSVNGVEQTPYNWSGNLSSLQSADISIGNATFESGKAYKFKAWTNEVNNLQDCNHYNDTCFAFDLGTQMCGYYTLGGESPDFSTFTDASILLNNAGMVCPVIIDVRDGSYNEQIYLTQITGSSSFNTITFRGENADSSLAEIFYQIPNTATDFTVNLIGTDYIHFENLGIRRENGDIAVYASQGCHNVVFDHCRLSKVFSPETSVDTAFAFYYNNIEGKDVSIKSPAGSPKGRFIFQGNTVSSVEVNYANPLIFQDNRGNSALTSYSGYFNFSQVQNALISGNRCNNLRVGEGRNINLENNDIFHLGWYDHARGIHLENVVNGLISENNVLMREGFVSRGIELSGCKNIDVMSNDCKASASHPNWDPLATTGSFGIFVVNNSRNIEIGKNTIGRYNDQYWSAEETFFGIYTDSGDSLNIHRNVIDGLTLNTNKHGTGIFLSGVTNKLECDSNIVNLVQNRGIYVNSPLQSNWIIKRNTINSIRDIGVDLEGRKVRFDSNRIFNIEAGTGIVVNGNQHVVSNNFIHARGSGNAKGITLKTGASNSKIVFNSVSITGTNVINGRALEILGGNNYLIKDNIFSNTGSGYAVYVVNMPSQKSFDFNNYYSSGDNFGFYAGVPYSQMGQWSSIVNGDVNSMEINPYYASPISFLPYQKQLNGAGTAAGGIVLDIENEIRNQQAPDIGAEEFMVDFGISELLSPSNACDHNSAESVTILLRQFGDIPFQNIELAYQINNGPVKYDVVPGSINNDIEFTFNDTEDLSNDGAYYFKIWLLNNGDDNMNNDTLRVLRKTAESPIVTFDYSAGCSNEPVLFNATAYVPGGAITQYEWDFGTGDSSLILPAQIQYLYPNSLTYYATVRAYSDQECYTEYGDSIFMNETPIAQFSAFNHCNGSPLSIENSTVDYGSAFDYSWDFGDGYTSTNETPTHQYALSNDYEITLIVSNALGCSDTAVSTVEVYETPQLTLNLLNSYPRNVGNIYLVGEPYGGSYSGAGVMGNIFNPMSIPNQNNTVIQYQYTDPLTGCSNTISRNVAITPNANGTAILMHPTSEVACLGDMVILFVQAYGPNIQYQWYKNNVLIPGANQSVLIFNSVGYSHQANYKVKITTSNTVLFSNSASIQVLSNFSNQFETGCDEFTWELNGETYYESGIYTWVGENSAGCDSTVYLNLTLNKVVLNANVPFTVCEGMTVNINAQSLGQGTITWPDATIDDTWTTTLLASSTINALSIVDGVTCSESISFNVVQHDIPLNFIAADTMGFCGDSAVIQLPFSNYNYNWEHGNFDSLAVMDNSGWYFATLSNAFCSVYDSVWVEILKAEIFTNDTLICEQTEANLLVGASNISSLGDITVLNGDSLFVDGVKSAILGFNAIGQNVIQIDNEYGFEGGDHVVLLQMQGVNAGVYQYNFIQAIGDGIMELQLPLSSDFVGDANAKAQVLKISHYDHMIVNGVVTCEAWNGSVGGVIAFYAEQGVVINDNGKIEANGKGFAGGNALTSWGVGYQGASAVSNGTGTYLSNGAGGGGGNAEWCHSGQGGGGGGFVMPGGNGGAPCMQCGGGWATGDCTTSGYGGEGLMNLEGIYLGSGGGSGGQDGDNPDGGGAGGSGGGIILIHTPEISGNGVIESVGESGDDGLGETGGGGGGSGGTVCFYSENVNVPALIDGGMGGKQGDSRFGGNGSPGLLNYYSFVPVSNVDILWSTGEVSNIISPNLSSSQWISLKVSRNGFECWDSVYIEIQPNSIPMSLIDMDSLGVCGSEVTLSADVVDFDLVWNDNLEADSVFIHTDAWVTVKAIDGVCSRADSIYVSFLNPEVQSSSTVVCEGGIVELTALSNWSNVKSLDMTMVDSQWSVGSNSFINGDTVLGPFANVDLEYQLPLFDHDSIEVSFDLYPYDTWDYTEPFEVYINDSLVASAVFNSGGCSNSMFVNQGCANGYCASPSTCYPYYRFTFRMQDDSDSIHFRINQYNGQELCDESWAIDNFEIDIYKSNPLIWSTGQTDAVVQVQPSSSTVYTLTYSNNGFSCIDSILISVNPVDTLYLTSIVPSDSVYVLGTQLISIPGDYIEIFSSISGCDSIVHLHLEHELICDLVLSADSICQGTSVIVNTSYSGGDMLSYQWQVNGLQNQATINSNPNVDSTFVLIVTSGIQTCSDTAFVEVSPATMYYIDADFDGFGAGSALGFCSDPGVGYVLNASDCADNNASANPLGVEACSNGWDDDCLNGDLDCADTGPGIAIGISNIGQWGTGVQTNININQNLGVNDIQSDGDGVDIWYQFTAQTNAVRIAYRGSLTLIDDNRLMLYDHNDDFAMQWIPLIVEDDVHPGAVGTLNADGGSEILYFDQLNVGSTYYICIQNTNDIYGTGLLTVSYLYGSAPDIMPYTNYTGIYNNTCQNFKARFRPNAYQYTVQRWSSAIMNGNPEWAYTIPNLSYSVNGVASTVCQLGKITGANLTGANQNLYISVDVTYQLKDAFGNNNWVFGRSNAAGVVGLATESDLFVRTTDQCPVYKSPIFGSIATNRSVCGTKNYDWNFTMQVPTVSLPNLVSGPLGGSRVLSLAQVPGISNGQRYDVKVRSNHFDNVTSTVWGSVKCVRTMGAAGMPTLENEGVVAERSFNGISASIYPNPNNGNTVALNVNGMEGLLQVRVTDATGKLIQLSQYAVEGSLNTNLTFDHTLSNGLYLVELTNGQQSQTMRMVVNR